MSDALNNSNDGFDGPAGVSPIDETAESWVRRLQTGLSIEEEADFAQWLSSHEGHEASYRKYQAAWDRFEPLASAIAAGRVSTEQRIVVGDFNPSGTVPAGENAYARRGRPVVGWFAPAIGLAAAVMILFAVLTPRNASQRAIPLPALCEDRILADGSTVQLNRGAKITVQYNATERRVRLERGEAIFNVAEDVERPFIVVAGAVEVRAVGTVFNVWFDAAAVEVVVTEGSVRVGEHPAAIRGGAASLAGGGSAGDSDDGVTVLGAGQRVLVPLSASAVSPQVTTLTPAEIEARLAWQPRLLDFDDAPLSAIVVEFNRRNPVRLVVTDPVVADRRMTASFRSDNLEAFVRLLEANIGVRAERLNETEITLRRD